MLRQLGEIQWPVKFKAGVGRVGLLQISIQFFSLFGDNLGQGNDIRNWFLRAAIGTGISVGNGGGATYNVAVKGVFWRKIGRRHDSHPDLYVSEPEGVVATLVWMNFLGFEGRGFEALQIVGSGCARMLCEDFSSSSVV